MLEQCPGVRGVIRPQLPHPLCRTCQHMAHLYAPAAMKPEMGRKDGVFACNNRRDA